ncbi:hypothetical protein N7G274_007322 [Stereocaulon virgatum]|uniref:Uncharacterized protein n=1 Tax=Stereocaulon virgatum TaxID=373712 RepID=A0ABR4A574_9LECA
MARTLPWLKNAATSTAQPSKPRPTKRQRTLDPASEPESGTSPRAIAAKKKQASSRADRTPTTSPPLDPPPTSPLRPGFNADDIYIMVEDEFLSTARLFTAHLHHAEYVRLKNEAKKRNVDGIERPIDSITEMRAETRKKKGAVRQEVRAKAAVDKAAPSTRRGKGEGSGTIESDSEEEERNDDLWQGTQLQRFMSTSSRKTLAGLTGLQGVVSHTRAAAGLARAEKRTSLHAQTTPTKRIGRRDRDAEVVDDETDEDTDDLDAPSHRRTTVPERKTFSIPTHKAVQEPPNSKAPPPSPSPPHSPPRRAFLDITLIPQFPPSSEPPSKEKPQPHPGPPITHDSQENMKVARERLEARRKAKARRERMGKAEKESTGVAVDEIPVFLV